MALILISCRDMWLLMKIDVALIHYPVCNKNSEIIGSAVTNLDLHDIARASRTYGVDTFYVVTPFADQKKLVNEIIDHWQSGHGSTYNPDRKEAFSLIKLVDDVESLYVLAQEKWGEYLSAHGYNVLSRLKIKILSKLSIFVKLFNSNILKKIENTQIID